MPTMKKNCDILAPASCLHNMFVDNVVELSTILEGVERMTKARKGCLL